LPHDYVCPQAIRTPIAEELYPTAYVAQQSCAWLDRHAAHERSRPFFLMVSFPDPHHPFTPPGHYWSMYSPHDMALPPSFDPGIRALARPVAWALAQRARGEADTQGQAAFAADAREAREAMALTCGMIAMIDDAVGSVLERLAACAFTHATVVIFTSDHGDFLGDHRLLLKGPAHYESITHVPFIWAEPGQSEARRSEILAGTLDIAPTILDRARIEPYNGIQGISLLPALSESRALPGWPARPCLVIEDEQQRAALGFSEGARLRTVVTQRWRMTIVEHDRYGELYDLAADPHEMHNLFDDPGHRGVRARLMETLAYRQMELADRSPLPSGRA
jgi:arylsulfatase A-like enzyme